MKLTLLAVVAVLAATPALAQTSAPPAAMGGMQMSAPAAKTGEGVGVVKAVDAKAGKVTLHHGLERLVMHGVARSRQERRALRAMAPVHVAMVGVALAIGLATGGFAGGVVLRREPATPTLAQSLSLAPSTLLVAAR